MANHHEWLVYAARIAGFPASYLRLQTDINHQAAFGSFDATSSRIQGAVGQPSGTVSAVARDSPCLEFLVEWDQRPGECRMATNDGQRQGLLHNKNDDHNKNRVATISHPYHCQYHFDKSYPCCKIVTRKSSLCELGSQSGSQPLNRGPLNQRHQNSDVVLCEKKRWVHNCSELHYRQLRMVHHG